MRATCIPTTDSNSPHLITPYSTLKFREMSLEHYWKKSIFPLKRRKSGFRAIYSTSGDPPTSGLAPNEPAYRKTSGCRFLRHQEPWFRRGNENSYFEHTLWHWMSTWKSDYGYSMGWEASGTTLWKTGKNRLFRKKIIWFFFKHWKMKNVFFHGKTRYFTS